MSKSPVFSDNDVKVLSYESCHEGFLKISRLTLKHRLYEGGWSEPFQREIMERNPGVGVLLYDPDLDKVVMVEQFRAGCLDNTHGPWVLELVAGIMDGKAEEGEENGNPEAVARREALEEADIQVGVLLPICEYYNSPGGSSEKLFLFCARVDADRKPGVFGLREEHENIRTVILDRQEAEDMLRVGQINNAMSIIALQWLKMNLEEVRTTLQDKC